MVPEDNALPCATLFTTLTSSRHRFRVCVTVALISAACLGSGCSVLLDRGPAAPHSRATISGTVRVPAGMSPVRRRTVRATEIATGRHYTTRTNDVGDYTFLIPPGSYRVELSRRQGEEITQPADAVDVGPGDIRAGVDFALAAPPGTLVR